MNTNQILTEQINLLILDTKINALISCLSDSQLENYKETIEKQITSISPNLEEMCPSHITVSEILASFRRY